MKRKMLKFLVTISLLAALTGCGKKEEAQSGTEESAVVEEKNETADEVALEETTEAEAAEDGEDYILPEKPAAEEVAAEDSDFLKVDVTDVNMTAADEARDRYEIVKVSYTKIALDEADAKKYPALAAVLEEKNKVADEENLNDLNRMKENHIEFEVDGDYYPVYESSSRSRIARADKTVLCVLSNYYSFEGGVHGYYAVDGETYDVASGQQLSLADIVTDKDGFITSVVEKLLEKYPGIMFMEDLNTYFTKDDYLSGDRELSWSMDYNGVTIYFEPYELASYADGLLKVRFSFASDGKFFDSKYMAVPSSYITPVTSWTNTYADVNGDGQEEELIMRDFKPDQEWGANEWKLMIGEEELEDPTYSFDNESYLLCRDGKFFIYLFDTVENDYSILNIGDLETRQFLGEEYEFSNYGFESKDYGYDDTCWWQTNAAFLDPDCFVLATRMDVFGTYSGLKTYHAASDGKPVSDDEFFEVPRMGFLIEAVRDLPCKIVDKDGNVLDENGTLPAGVKLRIIRSNGENAADLQAGDYNIIDEDYGTEEYPFWSTEDPLDLNRGTFYRVEYEIVDYERVLDGESIFDLFKGMMYAG